MVKQSNMICILAGKELFFYVIYFTNVFVEKHFVLMVDLINFFQKQDVGLT